MSTCYFHILLTKNPVNRLTIVICVKTKISKVEKYKGLERMIKLENLD